MSRQSSCSLSAEARWWRSARWRSTWVASRVVGLHLGVELVEALTQLFDDLRVTLADVVALFDVVLEIEELRHLVERLVLADGEVRTRDAPAVQLPLPAPDGVERAVRSRVVEVEDVAAVDDPPSSEGGQHAATV